MSAQTTIQLTPEAEKILRDLREMPQWMVEAVAQGMDKANAMTVSHIQQARLTGIGPFPVAEHRLGVRSGRLHEALWASKATVIGTNVESAIGDNVKYAAIHEFGGVIHHEVGAGTARLRTDRQGNLLRQTGHRHLAVFAKAGHKRVKEVAYEAGAHDVVMPERAPIRTGIQENLQQYGQMVSEAIQEAWDGMKGA